MSRKAKSSVGDYMMNYIRSLTGSEGECPECVDLIALNYLTPVKVFDKREELTEVIAKRMRQFLSDDIGIGRRLTIEERLTPEVIGGLINRAVSREIALQPDNEKMRGLGDLVKSGLSAIGIKKQCDGCDKRQKFLNRVVPFRKPKTGPLQFVWCYWHEGAKQDEIRFSMRSIEANYQGEFSFLVIGDKPPWYEGPWIDKPRLAKGRGFRRGLRDVLSKMNMLSGHPAVDDQFVWMMDDVFMVNPVTREEIEQPRADGRIKSSRVNGWRSVKTNTKEWLESNEMQVYDYATHLPHYVEKAKLNEMFKSLDPEEGVFLWEVAYHNFFGHKPLRSTPFLRRVRKAEPLDWYESRAEPARFFNVFSNGWNNEFRNWLLGRFPDPHSDEDASFVRSINRLSAPRETEGHFLLVQSAYTDEEVSRARLDVTRSMFIPCMQGQKDKVQVVVSVCKSDPLLSERMDAFQQCGHGVRFVFREPAQVPVTLDNVCGQDPWGLPGGRRIAVTRCDDDDGLAVDFFTLTKERLLECDWEVAVLQWPFGYTLYDGRLYRSRRPGNQFITIVSDSAMDPHMTEHWKFPSLLPTLTVNNSRGWIWNRHDHTIMGTRKRHMPRLASPPNRTRWSVQLP